MRITPNTTAAVGSSPLVTLEPTRSSPSVSSPCAEVSGHRTPAHRFFVSRSERVIDGDALQNLLHGGAVAHIVRGYLEPCEASQLAAAFDQTVSRQRDDGVPALTAGASHYGKTVAGYFVEVQRTQPEMRAIYDTAGVDLDKLSRQDLQKCLDDGQSIRERPVRPS